MFVSMSRTIGNSIALFAPAKCGTGPMSIIWCTAGVSGIEAPAMRASRGLQTPQQITTVSASTSPRVVRTRFTRPPSTSMPSDLGVRGDRERARLLRALAHQRAGAQRVDHADARRVEAADDHALVDERDELLHLGGCHEPHVVHTPRLRRGHPPPQLLHALLRAGDLDPAGVGEHAELVVLLDAVERQRRHLLRVVDRVDEVRGVAGRAAGVGQRALVDQHEVGPAEPRQVIGEAVAHDAGADHDRLRRGRQG